MKPRIPYTKPSISVLEIAYAVKAVNDMGNAEHCYDSLNRFEELFREHLGVPYAIATSSCTGALHLGLSALHIGPGDEVILADTGWIATAAPIVHLGATPVFVDILPDTWCIDPEKAEAHITQNTKAIIATHLYGNLCDIDALLAIGKACGIPVIEDAAEAIGSVYHGKRAGSMGEFGVFSFHGSKTVSTGEGGMFVTHNADLFETALTLSNHGRKRGQTLQFWPEMIGFKYRMSNVQAGIGCAQMERIDSLIERKREILRYYRRELAHYQGLQMNPELEGTVNGAWMPTVVFDLGRRVTREKLQAIFAEENIDARVFFWPLSSLPMFTDCLQNKNAHYIPKRAINLPSYHDMTAAEQDRVIACLVKCLEQST